MSRERKLLGYVVKLPDGTRSPSTPTPMHVTDAADKLLSFAPMGSHLVPVFSKPKPAPAEGAAEGRYALHFEDVKGTGFFAVLNRSGGETGTRDEVLAVKGDRLRGDGVLVRVLPNGAHEAALEAARREECARVLLELRGTLVQCRADFATEEAHAEGLAHAVRCLDDLLTEKGQAQITSTDPWGADCDFPQEQRDRVLLVPHPHYGMIAVHWSRVDAGTAPDCAVAYVREDVASDEARLFRDQRNVLASKLATEEDETTALRRERDAATEHAAAFAEVSRIVGIAYEADGRPVVPGPTDVVLAEVSEVLVAANQSRELKSERDSVRRERDVLLARVEKLREALSTVERQTRGASDEADARIAWDVAGDAILADNEAQAAGKGVG